MAVRPARPALPCDDPATWRECAVKNATRGVEMIKENPASPDADVLLLEALQQLRIAVGLEAVKPADAPAPPLPPRLALVS